MKNLVIFLLLIGTSIKLNAQIKEGYFFGKEVDEWVYSENKKEHILLETIDLDTEIILGKNKIQFKKGRNADWLENKWVFDKTIESKEGSTYYRYFDEREQMILIDPKENLLLYYYNWDKTFENFRNLTVYKNLQERKSSDYGKNEENNQEVLAKFIITDATFNGEDVSENVIENKAYTVFYKFKGSDEIYMANYFSGVDSQSYGKLYDSDLEKFEETQNEYQYDVLTSSWRYINDYDDKKGTAKIELTRIFKPQGVTFELKIISENLDFMVYKGYMEGTLDFSVFN